MRGVRDNAGPREGQGLCRIYGSGGVGAPRQSEMAGPPFFNTDVLKAAVT